MKNSTPEKTLQFRLPKAIITFILVCVLCSSYAQISRIGSVSISPTSQTACVPSTGSINVSFTITATRSANGSVNGTYTVTGLPSGVTAAPIGGFTANGNTAFPSRTLKLTISSAALAGTSTISVKLAQGVDQKTTTCLLILNQVPILTCPSHITANNDVALCGSSQSFSATSNETVSYKSGAAGITSPHFFPVGTNTVTATATNTCGTASCSFLVNVIDKTLPVITHPSDITIGNDAGTCGAGVAYSVSATDNCSGVNLVQTAGLPSGSLFPKGTTTNSFTATDAFGNTASASFNVIVIDTEDPTITCNGDITKDNDAGACGAVVSYSISATDNCPGEIIEQIAGLASGSLFPQGTTTNTFIVTDGSGNTASCSFDVTVRDIERPTITVPADISKNVDALGCKGIVTYSVSHADNCAGAVVTQVAGLPSGSAFPLGITKNTFLVTDAAGLTAMSSFNVIVSTTLAVDAGSDEQSFYGYNGGQTINRTASASGGAGIYDFAWSMDRAMMCNQANDMGDEAFIAGNCINTACPTSGALTDAPVCSGSASVAATLIQPADVCVIVTDAFGCEAKDCFYIHAQDVRCFSGESNIAKVSICHRPSSTTNSFVQLCVSQSAAANLLSRNSADYAGACRGSSSKTDENSDVDMNSGNTAMESSVRVYPNPANNLLNLEFEATVSADYQVQIFDNLGRKVFSSEGVAFVAGNRLSVPVTGMSPGLYSLRLNVGDRSSSVKVVVSK